MKKSFISKIFKGIAILLVVIFIIQILFQRLIFPVYLLRQVRNNIEDNLPYVIESSANDFEAKLDEFSSNTQTTSAIFNADNVITRQYPVTVIEANNKVYNIFTPKLGIIKIEVGDTLSGQFYYQETDDIYIPKVLRINSVKVYGETNVLRGKNSTTYKNWLIDNNINTDEVIQLSGTVSQVGEIVEAEAQDIAFSREVLNLASGNISSVRDNDYGLSYISSDINQNPTNLVYTSRITYGTNEYLLITIYPLSSISLVTTRLTFFNLLMYSVALILLLMLSVVYLRKVSIPLKKINAQTKRLAKLDFAQMEEFKTDDEIGELSKSINMLSANLKTALGELNTNNQRLSTSMENEVKREKLRQDFVAGLSHELKTPLAIIQASSEGLSLDMFSNEEKEKQYEVIKKEIVKSNKLIQDMMQVYKIEQNEVRADWSEFDLSKVLDKVTNNFTYLANSKNILINSNVENCIVYGDELKFELVFSNLISNAIKYAPNDSEISINLTNDEFSIRNIGHIPEESIQSIFEPFFRIDKTRSRETGSTGLGLYIVKQILDQHNFEYGASNENEFIKVYFKIRK